MGNKYTVEAGTGNKTVIYYGTEWLLLALFKMHTIHLDQEHTLYWKRITVR